MVIYIDEYVDGDGLLDKANLEERCLDFYEGFISFSKPTIVLLDELAAGFAPSTAMEQFTREQRYIEINNSRQWVK